MAGRDRVEIRARRIYEFLTQHMNQGFTMPQLCRALRLNNGSTTRSAIRRARDLATEAGLHFPPAAPQNGMRYKVTNLPEEALDPTLQMGRVAQGVRDREQVGIDFLEQEQRRLPRDLQPIGTFYLEVQRTRQRAAAEIQRQADDMVLRLVELRRNGRQDGGG